MYRYFIIYKPYLVLSQFSPQDGKKTLADFFKVPKDVYPIGRLDNDSEGLLILTNDSTLNHRLLHPKFAHEREYWVQVDGHATENTVKALEHGVSLNINGLIYATKPCKANLFLTDQIIPQRNPPIRFRKDIPASWLQLVLTEGKNRQVRKMTAAIGFPTLRLIRFRIENITLGVMHPGDMVELSKEVVYKNLFNV